MMLSFSLLAITGLPQRFSSSPISIAFVGMLGGIEEDVVGMDAHEYEKNVEKFLTDPKQAAEHYAAADREVKKVQANLLRDAKAMDESSASLMRVS